MGLHPVRELLRAGRAVRAVHVAAGREASDVLDEVLALAAERRVPVRQVDRTAIDELAEGLVHQGIVATAPPFPYAGLDEVVERARARGEEPLLVALDGVTDPHNLGSIARTAEAVGAHGLIVPSRRAAGVTATSEKAAAGALAHLPLVRVPNLVRALKDLQRLGVWSVGLDADAPQSLYDCPLLDQPVAVVVGSEGRGLARLSQVACDSLVNLPMRGRVGSLNASVAGAVALYEILRRRNGTDGTR
ncbi:MAG: 23S rRNA (guanosine(2251)-2'-O)-methyltransferase RlmB [Actinobacteria bacterium]|nr:23S rRNA (guanosine(2251)-2'-O)-methyltransferase RlmB [Actinomycetota bacterium]